MQAFRAERSVRYVCRAPPPTRHLHRHSRPPSNRARAKPWRPGRSRSHMRNASRWQNRIEHHRELLACDAITQSAEAEVALTCAEKRPD